MSPKAGKSHLSGSDYDQHISYLDSGNSWGTHGCNVLTRPVLGKPQCFRPLPNSSKSWICWKIYLAFSMSHSTFSSEVYYEILFRLPLSDLSAARRTCQTLDDVTRTVLQDRARDVIIPFFADASSFWELMHITDGAVVGHVPLWFYDPSTEWTPTELTIMVPVQRLAIWQAHMEARR